MKKNEYNHLKIEKKWQKDWEKNKIYQAKTGLKGKKFYGLIEFPYPSGSGLHVGHIRSNTAMDIIARKRRMEGYNVLYPIGWDAFGLPTENYAIKTGINPEKVTKINTGVFRKQLKEGGFSFDWSREVNTTDPKYYKWTQWIFLQMFKKGLAYKKKTEINWCTSCKIGLANEEVVAGVCERCGGKVVKKEKEQWMLAITKYADRLDKDLDKVNYLEKIKIQQRNWIGKSEGSEIGFKIKVDRLKDENLNLQSINLNLSTVSVFTTRADTLFGATYVVLAPEHELVEKLKLQISNWSEVEEYIKTIKDKPDIERIAEDKEKTGVEIKGVKAINPATKEEIPIWIADYVLASYGTGAVMAVPAHDERDFEFAKKYHLPMKRVVEPIFVGKDGDGAVRNDLPFVRRNAVCAIVRNPKDGKYLCLSWRDHHMHGLVTGGFEENENLVQAAIREIQEETGYKNLKLTNDPEFVLHSQFFHRVKKENRWARFHYVFFDLINEEKDKIDDKEDKLHEIIWIEKNKIKDFFTVIEGEFTYNFINNPNYIFTGDGILHFSDMFDDLTSEEARKEITKFVGGKMVTKYKLRDWVFSRQRYWGEPIPLVFCKHCAEQVESRKLKVESEGEKLNPGWFPISEKDLPVLLPKVKSYKPTDNGESPLATISKWVNTTCPKCKGKAKRETDTMPNWAGSSWYFLRYLDPKNNKELVSKKNIDYWSKLKANSKKQIAGPVDWYNGGMEHTTLHLLYSRFWHKFLYDLKLVPTSEPYMKRTSHGMILAEGGEKMSKSKGNVTNPDEIIKLYGADTLRLYEMFIGPFDQAVSWNTESIIGPRRFLEKVWRVGMRVIPQNYQNFSRFTPEGPYTDKNFDNSVAFQTLLHKTIKKVSEDIESMSFNTAISSMMMLVNEMEKVVSSKEKVVSRDDFEKFLQILSPFAPHITEELYNQLQITNDKKTPSPYGHSPLAGGAKSKKQKAKSIHLSPWPKWDKKKIIEEKIKIAIQVNGKVRSEILISKDMTEEEIKKQALSDESILSWVRGKEIKKIIYVPGRILNIVV